MNKGNEQMNDPKKARWAITLFFIISGFGYFSWASRIPDIQQKLSLNDAELGSVLLALPVGLMLTLPVTGALLQRFSSRSIMFAGALAFNLMLSLIGFANETWQLVLILFAFGSSRNLLNISMNGNSVGVQALYDRSIITTFHGIWSVAGFSAVGFGALMIYFKIGPSWHFLGVGLAMVLLGFYAFPGSLKQPPAPTGRKGFALPDKTLVKYGLISFGSMSCEGTMIDWSGIYFQKAVHVSDNWVGVGFFAYTVMMAAGRFGGDKLVNRWGAAPMIRYSGILLFCGLLLAALLPYPVTASLGFMMAGLGVSCVVPLVFALGGKASKMSNGASIAAISTVGYFGFLLVPPAVGFLAEAIGLRWTFAIVSCFGVLIAVLVSQLKEEPATT
ncbi:MFS transporter [Chitinophaga horti]|uniref:MFS transporter n=1 Tax=Chitinophaga horti TaxID=2920382 RepID=A0ABY6J4Y9_9BACT|nr:MFS transporter [Chitinophaga horti]UYQ94570.1 MFS transporter [Chitinophaga horti]